MLITLPPGTRIAISYESATYDVATGMYTIQFAVLCNKLNGRSATVVLLPGTAEPRLVGLDVVKYQDFVLAEGINRMAIQVSAAELIQKGALPKDFYLLLGSSQRTTPSQFFELQLPAAMPPPPITPPNAPPTTAPPVSTDPTTVGRVFRPLLRYSRYGAGFVYGGQSRLKMSRYPRWDQLVASGQVTTDERLAINVMSLNEGPFDAINAYDDQIVSLGAMQKTINKSGRGELTKQIAEFRRDNPTLYQTLLGQYGWNITTQGAAYTDPLTGTIYSGTNLFNKIREGAATAVNTKNRRSQINAALAPLVRLGQDETFQDKQVLDFIVRMRSVLALKPIGSVYPISDYFQLPISWTVALDHSVNRPAHVTNYLSVAIARLLSSHPEINSNPNLWGANHTVYEKLLLEIYGPLRAKKLLLMEKRKAV